MRAILLSLTGLPVCRPAALRFEDLTAIVIAARVANIVRALQLAALRAFVRCLNFERIVCAAIATTMRGYFSLRNSHGYATSSIKIFKSADIARKLARNPEGKVKKKYAQRYITMLVVNSIVSLKQKPRL